MISKISAYTIWNLKALFKDKNTLVWAVLLPLTMFLMNLQEIREEKDLIPWWVYMAFSFYVYGIGVYALELKEAGELFEIFTRCGSSTVFFSANLVTQFIFSMGSIGLFSVLAGVIKRFAVSELIVKSFETILFCLPFAFIGYGVTLLEKFRINSIRMVLTILLLGMWKASGENAPFSMYNPFSCVIGLVSAPAVEKWIGYGVFVIVSLVLGGFSIRSFDVQVNARKS